MTRKQKKLVRTYLYQLLGFRHVPETEAEYEKIYNSLGFSIWLLKRESNKFIKEIKKALKGDLK